MFVLYVGDLKLVHFMLDDFFDVTGAVTCSSRSGGVLTTIIIGFSEEDLEVCLGAIGFRLVPPLLTIILKKTSLLDNIVTLVY